MIERIKCWIKGHNFEEKIFRTPIYQMHKMNDDKNLSNYGTYYISDKVNDDKQAEWWCHRCWKWVRLN